MPLLVRDMVSAVVDRMLDGDSMDEKCTGVENKGD